MSQDKIEPLDIEIYKDTLISFKEGTIDTTPEVITFIRDKNGKYFALKTTKVEITNKFDKNLKGFSDSEGTGSILLKSPFGKEIDSKLFEQIITLLNNDLELIDPEILYSNWKLRIKFSDPEKVKGILTITVGEKKIFDEPLHGRKEVFIPYIPIRREEKIIFKMADQEKPITRSMEFCEYLDELNVCILEHDCKENILINSKILNIAVVQLKYKIIKDGRVIKLTIDESLEKKLYEAGGEKEADNFRKEKEAYWKKVRYILEAVKQKAKIIVFPEFSIPFELLPEIQKYVDENKIIVVAGSHYVTEENLDKYKDLFTSEVQVKDLRKNICPIMIPSSKIVHTEKLLPAWVEREFLSAEGMNHGELKYILKISNKLKLGILICFEYLNELRNRFIETCDILLVPQTNPNTERFYEVALGDLDSPQYPGNKAYIMANGIFTFESKMSGGSSGLLLTLDKNSHKEQVKKTIKKPIDGIYEQFVLLASLNTEFNPARDIAQGQVPIKSKWIPVIEEREILERANNLTEKTISSLVALFDEDLEKQETLTNIIESEKKKIDEEARKFIEILQETTKCDGEELKNLLKSNASIIKKYSPLMYEENAKDLANLTPKEIKEKCCPVFIPIDM